MNPYAFIAILLFVCVLVLFEAIIDHKDDE